MHLVHYNKRYGSLADAVTHPDGLAVIGVMIEVSITMFMSFASSTNKHLHFTSGWGLG